MLLLLDLLLRLRPAGLLGRFARLLLILGGLFFIPATLLLLVRLLCLLLSLPLACAVRGRSEGLAASAVSG